LRRYRHMAEVRRGAKVYLWVIVIDLREAGKFKEALALIARRKDLLQDAEAARDMVRAVYDGWAAHLVRQNDWQGAVEVYTRALEAYPGDNHLEHNRIVTWDAWAGSRVRSKDWAGAVAVYEKALKQLPESAHLKNNLVYVVLLWVRETQDREGVAKADQLRGTLQRRFPKVAEIKEAGRDLVVRVVRQLR